MKVNGCGYGDGVGGGDEFFDGESGKGKEKDGRRRVSRAFWGSGFIVRMGSMMDYFLLSLEGLARSVIIGNYKPALSCVKWEVERNTQQGKPAAQQNRVRSERSHTAASHMQSHLRLD